jgi:predicted DNA-binding WGR domain protein
MEDTSASPVASARDATSTGSSSPRGMRLLSPREVLARRDAARVLGAAYLARLTPDRAQNARGLFEHLDILVETLDGRPVTILADIARDDGRVFSHVYEGPEDMWWEVSLSWMLATRLVGELAETIQARAPIVSRLMYGQRRNRAEKLAYLEKGTTFFEIAFDPDASVLSTRFGKIGTKGTANVQRVGADGAKQFEKKLAEKRKGGYRERTSSSSESTKRATKKSATKKSATKKSATKKSATKKSATKKSGTKKSETKRTATKKSATTNKSATKTPVSKARVAKPKRR